MGPFYLPISARGWVPFARRLPKGIKISDNLYYFVKGHMKGRKGKKKKAQQSIAKVVEVNNVPKSDALSIILKVKALAIDVGGLKKLKALVAALSD